MIQMKPENYEASKFQSYIHRRGIHSLNQTPHCQTTWKEHVHGQIADEGIL